MDSPFSNQVQAYVPNWPGPQLRHLLKKLQKFFFGIKSILW